MADPTSIITAITAIKNSIDIAKAVKEADSDLDKAILKEKIANLVDSLLDAKIKTTELYDLIQEKDREIENLKILLNNRKSPQTNKLPDECIKILQFLIECPSTSNEIAEQIELLQQKTDYFLDILKEKELVDYSTQFDPSPWNVDRIPHYALNSNGREFLIKEKLL